MDTCLSRIYIEREQVFGWIRHQTHGEAGFASILLWKSQNRQAQVEEQDGRNGEEGSQDPWCEGGYA